MTPKDVSAVLRHIATAIENSKQPSVTMVRHDLRLLLARIAEEQQQTGQQQQQGQQEQQGQQQEVGQQEQQALPKSFTGKQMIEGMLNELQKAFKAGDHDKFLKTLEKLDKAAV